MGLAHSPRIVTDGLVFYYDMGNPQKSWKGAPTTNLQLPNIIDWSGTAVIVTLNELSPIGTPVYSVTDNNASSYLERSRNITVPNNSNTYTISIYIKKTFGATSARLGFNSGFTGGTTAVQLNQRFNSDTGAGSVGSTQDLGDWWRWQFQLTNNSTGNTTLYCSFYPATGFYNSGDNAAATGTAIVSAIQTEQQSFATPFVNGTRSNTQAILDLTNNRTLTANSLTYNSNNTFIFNGTTNYLTLSANVFNTSLPNFTISTWVNKSVDGIIIGNHFHNSTWESIWLSPTLFIVNGASNNTTNRQQLTYDSPSNDIWHNIVAVNNSTDGFMKVYLDGSEIATRSATVVPWNSSVLPTIGTQRQNNGVLISPITGSIPTMMVHSKALTASEIMQNFNAVRGRYGI